MTCTENQLNLVSRSSGAGMLRREPLRLKGGSDKGTGESVLGKHACVRCVRCVRKRSRRESAPGVGDRRATATDIASNVRTCAKRSA
ncbi:MAG: hypothetical protein ACPIOQ_10485, partial [Promethearchaeia archaeon]